jgi:hypothetical protein
VDGVEAEAGMRTALTPRSTCMPCRAGCSLNTRKSHEQGRGAGRLEQAMFTRAQERVTKLSGGVLLACGESSLPAVD